MSRLDNFKRPVEKTRQAPNLRYGAQEAKTYLTNQKYEKDPNRETFVARPGRGANGESSN
jgi:hypothetical protein